MDSLERAKKELELKKVECAKDECLLKILEREAEIERLRGAVKIQEDKMKELKELLTE